MEEIITSVGIDIGTSTSKFIVSQLKIGKVSSHFALPKFEIIDRKVLYTSPVISTPLLSKDEIDIYTISEWLRSQYHLARINRSEIKSGAVIITGETAIKKNAEKILHHIAGNSGEFVVAIAGASLEAVLAGKGSGAYERSKHSNEIIANVDIGGGTANVVLFQKGHVLGTITFHVGGRLIEINETGKVEYISPSIQPWLTENKCDINVDDVLVFSQVEQLAEHISRDMLAVLAGKASIHSQDSMIHSSSFTTIPDINTLFISGGIGALLEKPEPCSLKEIAIHKDIGPMLASQVKKNTFLFSFSLGKADQTSRATVIGAGMQSTTISGSTIFIDSKRLPIRNLPVLSIDLQNISEGNTKDFIHQELLFGKELFTGENEIPLAIALKGLDYCSYSFTKRLATCIYHSFQQLFPNANAFVILCENDMAKALGQSLKIMSNPLYEVICIDQVEVDHGDYIDIGELMNETMVPVVIKTLAFSK